MEYHQSKSMWRGDLGDCLFDTEVDGEGPRAGVNISEFAFLRSWRSRRRYLCRQIPIGSGNDALDPAFTTNVMRPSKAALKTQS